MSLGHEDTYLGDVDVDFLLKLRKLSNKLSWQSPKSCDHLWVFWWSKDEGRHTFPSTSNNDLVPGTLINRWMINEKIKTAICNFKGEVPGNVMVQFWAPKMLENNRHILSTYDQPFGLTSVEHPFWDYMVQSKSREIIVDGEREEELGPVGRVFRNKLLELSPDIQYYSNKEFPMLHDTINCNVKSISALPVFDPLSRCCVGVLEVVGSRYVLFPERMHKNAYKVLKAADLGSLDMCSHLEEESPTCLQHALDEIREVLEVVYSIHKLPLAQIWIPRGQRNAVDYGGNMEKSCNSFDLSSTEEMRATIAKSCNSYAIGFLWNEFLDLCKVRPMRKGEGLVGKAILSRKPCFCIDITQVSITDYPFAHYANKFRLISCFAICLRSTYTGNSDYVLELFLPEGCRSPQTLLGSILGMLKQHFRSFKVASGEELGEELLAKVIKFWMNDELDSSKIYGTTISPPRPEALQIEGEVVQLDPLDRQLSVEGTICGTTRSPIRLEVVQLDPSDQRTTSSPSTPKALQNEGPWTDPSDQQLIMEDDIYNRRNFVGVEKSDIIGTDLEKTYLISEKEYEKTEISISYEVLKGHFGGKLEDVAKSLGIRPKALQTKVELDPSDQQLIVEDAICGTTRSPPRPEGLQNEGKVMELDPSDQQLIVEDAVTNRRNLVGAEQSDFVDTVLQKTFIVLERQHKKTESSISYEVLKDNFGRKLGDVARSLGISRSTLKRVCRTHGIIRWPSYKRNKVNPAPSNIEHNNKFIQGGKEGIPESSRGDVLCSDLSPNQVTPVVAHTIPRVTPMQDASAVTIKAKYRDDTIRFQLSFSSGMVDLKDKVMKRMPSLKDIPFSIKYLDDEGEWVLIACDEDLQDCMGTCSSLEKIPIKMLIQVAGLKNLKSPETEGGRQNGTSWAFELGSEQQICPMSVEDLECPRHMLVEVAGLKNLKSPENEGCRQDGTSGDFELGSEQQICPIIVEDLECAGHMLVEVAGLKNLKSPETESGRQDGTSWAFELGSEQQICPICVEDLEWPRPMLFKVAGLKNLKSHETEGGRQNGASWAFELGSEQQICPIIVEDLKCPGHMLVEVLCNDHGRFIEIAVEIHCLELTILKGVMQSHSDNTWARFIIEAPRGFHRLDIFWPLVQLLEHNPIPISSKI